MAGGIFLCSGWYAAAAAFTTTRYCYILRIRCLLLPRPARHTMRSMLSAMARQGPEPRHAMPPCCYGAAHMLRARRHAMANQMREEGYRREERAELRWRERGSHSALPARAAYMLSAYVMPKAAPWLCQRGAGCCILHR